MQAVPKSYFRKVNKFREFSLTPNRRINIHVFFGRNFKDLSSYSIAGNTIIIKRFLLVLQVC